MDIRQEIEAIKARLRSYLETSPLWQTPLFPEHLNQAVRSYLLAGGKYLRPALLLWSCRALGGDESSALPAALAVEVSHTWTLVHDDIIDRDETRRGRLTVHAEFQQKGGEQLGLGDYAAHYGQSLALLAGDVQHSWAVSLFAEAAAFNGQGADPRLVLGLVRELEADVMPKIISGEVFDLQLSRRPLPEVAEAEVLRMVADKTATLFSFCARAGAHFAAGQYLPKGAAVNAMGDFGYHVGMAFQLQDDILGLRGDPRKLGKPVGSDLREGKRTVPLVFSWQHATPDARRHFEAVAGNAQATEAELAEIKHLLENLGGIAHAQELARHHIDHALANLKGVKPGPAKKLLEKLAHFALERTY